MSINEDLKSINKEKYDDRFDNFMILHDAEVKRLSGYKNLSSIVIYNHKQIVLKRATYDR